MKGNSMKFTKLVAFNCSENKGKISIKCNCQPENNSSEEKENCCQVEVIQNDSAKDSDGNCEIEINCDCASNCC